MLSIAQKYINNTDQPVYQGSLNAGNVFFAIWLWIICLHLILSLVSSPPTTLWSPFTTSMNILLDLLLGLFSGSPNLSCSFNKQNYFRFSECFQTTPIRLPCNHHWSVLLMDSFLIQSIPFTPHSHLTFLHPFKPAWHASSPLYHTLQLSGLVIQNTEVHVT